jgi:hypothetical protein
MGMVVDYHLGSISCCYITVCSMLLSSNMNPCMTNFELELSFKVNYEGHATTPFIFIWVDFGISWMTDKMDHISDQIL